MIKKIMLVGPRGCGKSTLANRLDALDRPLRMSQDTIYGPHTIDVPASYLENHWMYKHVIAIAQNHASHVLLVLANGTCEPFYSPGFARVFTCPVSGVITGISALEEADPTCLKALRLAGVETELFAVDAITGAGLETLMHHIETTKG